MSPRVIIHNGEIGDVYSLLSWAVRDSKGEKLEASYSGPGTWGDGFVVIGDSHDPESRLTEYSVDSIPTARSARQWAGYKHAWNQKRRRVGGTWHEAFRSGWDAGWRDRDRDDDWMSARG